MNDINIKILDKSHGGIRPNSGRKEGTGKFGEATLVKRIPASQEAIIEDFLAEYQRRKMADSFDKISLIELLALERTPIKRPLFSTKVSAGFPSPADDHIEKRLDPTEYLVDQEDATFFYTMEGLSMIDAGLVPGDKLVVDRSKNARINNIVLAMLNGKYTVKFLARAKTGMPRLVPSNSSGEFPIIEIKEFDQFEIVGVVTGSFRRFQK